MDSKHLVVVDLKLEFIIVENRVHLSNWGAFRGCNVGAPLQV